MTYETVDNFLTLAITALLYGAGLWLVAAFTIFVATHDFANNDSDHLSEPESVQTQQETPHQPIEAVEPEAAAIQTEALEQLSTEQIAITCEPVDFTLWKVADLRCPKLRQSFGIPLRQQGQARAHRKTELEALYCQAMASAARRDRHRYQHNYPQAHNADALKE